MAIKTKDEILAALALVQNDERFKDIDLKAAYLEPQSYERRNAIVGMALKAVDPDYLVKAIRTTNGFNGISHQIADCCCETQRMIERQTCELINNQNANTQRIVDYLYCKELENVKSERDDYKLQLSQARQTSTIINSLNPQAIPAYLVQNPNCCYNPVGYGLGCAGGATIQ